MKSFSLFVIPTKNDTIIDVTNMHVASNALYPVVSGNNIVIVSANSVTIIIIDKILVRTSLQYFALLIPVYLVKYTKLVNSMQKLAMP